MTVRRISLLAFIDGRLQWARSDGAYVFDPKRRQWAYAPIIARPLKERLRQMVRVQKAAEKAGPTDHES